MRPIVKGDWPTNPDASRIQFTSHKQARPIIEGRTGRYCHFCEMKLTNPVAIEHIKNQGLLPRLINNWDNFLLICDFCNSRKSKNKSPIVSRHYWPHKHNTYMAVQSRIDGVIQVNPSLTQLWQREKAANTINLYGLDEIIDSEGGDDQRYIERLTTIDKANKRFIEYTANPPTTTVANIVDMAGATGFWSVWYKVFENYPVVLTALLNSNEQRGTYQAGFPVPNYLPIPRNNPTDI